LKIFETHMHLDSKCFDTDRQEIITKCTDIGIEKMINIGVDEQSSQYSIALAKKHKNIYASVGYHPHKASEFDMRVLKDLSTQKKVVAIGEIGLDYYKNYCDKKTQKITFIKQVQFAVGKDIPIILHDRDAHSDCFKILKSNRAKRVVFHCYSGDYEFAQEVLSMGWLISFSGVITFKNSKMDDLISDIPKDKFLVETDCPYLSPLPNRGKRNSPLNLPYIIKKIAILKNSSPENICSVSYQNSCKFFDIDD